jgi:SAM-dependent methyltransferase
MRASEILDLASRAGVSPPVAVLDLCCGVAGPGRLIVRTLGCDYLGVDADPRAIEVARQRAGGSCRFEVSRVPPLPAGQFDVVLLLETMLAFPDKVALMRAVSSALPPGGRFAFTIETGHPLTRAERALMPAADTVWPTPLADLRGCLQRAGMRVLWQQDCTEPHHTVVEALVLRLGAMEREFGAGDPTLHELLTAHRIWSHWLRERRVRKFAFVTERRA